jgi:hypothetical protein
MQGYGALKNELIGFSPAHPDSRKGSGKGTGIIYVFEILQIMMINNSLNKSFGLS